MPDLPSAVKVGDLRLSGNFTITNISLAPDEAATDLVGTISVTPACGARINAAECPRGGDDPAAIAIDPAAFGTRESAGGNQILAAVYWSQSMRQWRADASTGIRLIRNSAVMSAVACGAVGPHMRVSSRRDRLRESGKWERPC